MWVQKELAELLGSWWRPSGDVGGLLVLNGRCGLYNPSLTAPVPSHDVSDFSLIHI